MKLIFFIAIRASQGILISVSIPTLLLFAVLFAWAFFLFMSLHQLRDLLPAHYNTVEYLNIHRLMQKIFNNLNAINFAVSAIRTPN